MYKKFGKLFIFDDVLFHFFVILEKSILYKRNKIIVVSMNESSLDRKIFLKILIVLKSQTNKFERFITDNILIISQLFVRISV